MVWNLPLLGPIGFSTPWLLWALVLLPVLWILLRAVPPAPIRRRFPGVILLLGLTDDDSHSDKTPWWLLLLRMLAVGAIIIGFSGPVLNPKENRAGTAPVMILIDGTWADAADWPARMDRVGALLSDAGRAGRPVAVTILTSIDPGPLVFQAADAWAARLPGLRPEPFEPIAFDIDAWVSRWGDEAFDTIWLSDGLARKLRSDLLLGLSDRGAVTIIEGARPIYGVRPAKFESGLVHVAATRTESQLNIKLPLVGIGVDPAGNERELAGGTVIFQAGESDGVLELKLPPELRNRISRFVVSGERSAGAVSLVDDGLRRREVALIAGRSDREGLELLSPLHYLEKALQPTADLIDGALPDIILANPDVIVLADVAILTDTETRDVAEWVANGGLLLRFAGPRLAGSDVSRDVEDPLMPVRLRRGGRSVGGAMSWGEPKQLLPFPEDSPFYGLSIPDDVRVISQVVAQPDADLADRVIAALADGTPLVTRKPLGDGQIVLFHVTANAEWSSLPLSGLFVDMLERLAVSAREAGASREDLAGTTWVADRLLDAFGAHVDPGTMPGIPGDQIADGEPGPALQPGVYKDGDQSIAVNVINADTELNRMVWPQGTYIEGLNVKRQTPLKGLFLVAALYLLILDIAASLLLTGRLTGSRAARIAVVVFLALGAQTPDAQAQSDDDFALSVTNEVVLAHVLTGNPEVDRVTFAGLRGIGETLTLRTSVEPATPVGIDLERDELAFLPMLYWPITEDQSTPSDTAYAKLNKYLRTGGMILFDTRDAGFGSAGSRGDALQRLARPLDIPPLERIPDDHVLTRTFYLLQDFPGRFASRDVWVEAAPPGAEKIEGMPFRNLNDNVTPIVVGGNDWAAAWAIDDRGSRLFPVGRGFAGERQREIALRFGVNLIMHVLTGNYKSDQVHVPALLDRLGQ